MHFNDSDIMRRAMRAYFRSEGEGAQQPSNASWVEEHNDRCYAVLHNANGILAVYRIQPRGTLKRLRRWPAALA